MRQRELLVELVNDKIDWYLRRHDYTYQQDATVPNDLIILKHTLEEDLRNAKELARIWKDAGEYIDDEQ